MHVIYEGPSLIDGKPIVAALTGLDSPSTNAKTGPMLQTWILRQDMKPGEAIKTGEDESVCGSCPSRGTSCYVLPFRGPDQVWNNYNENKFNRENLKLLGRNRVIRLGAYGDPAAVPYEIWKDLTTYADGFTGYTHEPFIQPEIMEFCQASADTEDEAILYQSMGWKSFRVKDDAGPLIQNEILCPYEKSGVQCISCRLCDGKTKNIAVNVHGSAHKKKVFNARYA